VHQEVEGLRISALTVKRIPNGRLWVRKSMAEPILSRSKSGMVWKR
jgi:hypothetical protein